MSLGFNNIVTAIKGGYSGVYNDSVMQVLNEQTDGKLIPMLRGYEQINAVTQVEVTNYYEVYVTVNDSLLKDYAMRVMTDLASLHPTEINLLDMHGSKSVNTVRLWWN